MSLDNTLQYKTLFNESGFDFDIINIGDGYVVNLYIYDVNKAFTYHIYSIVALTQNVACFLPLLTGNDTFVFEAHAATLTNKTINRPDNTLTNLDIVNADVSALAAVDTTKLADGTVSNTEFQYLNGQDQYLATTSDVTFNTLKIYDSLANNTYTVSSSVDLVANRVCS